MTHGKFFLFISAKYDPGVGTGGMDDYEGSFDTLIEAMARAEERQRFMGDNAHHVSIAFVGKDGCLHSGWSRYGDDGESWGTLLDVQDLLPDDMKARAQEPSHLKAPEPEPY